jgi:hypothetical protein
VVFLLVRVTSHALAPLDNPDTWFHLRLGHEFLGGWSLRHPGSLSGFATTPWVPTQWSTELLMARAADWFGLAGVAVLFGLLFVAFVLAVFHLCRSEGDLLPATVATGVVFLGAGGSLSARPQVVSLLLFVVTVAAWRRAGRTGRPPYWLVPVTWVWATAHGLWSAAVLVGLVTCVGLALDHRHGWRTTARFASVPVLSLAAACLTPVGPRLLTSQLAVGERSRLITEWGPTDFRTPDALLVAAMVGVTVILWSRRGGIPWTVLLQLLLAGGWMLLVSRMVSFGAILAAPLFVSAVSQVLPARPRRPGARRLERVVVRGAALACAVTLVVVAPRTADRPGGVPTALGPALGALPSGTAVLVEDSVGAWLEYAYPGLSPVMDGMLDAYPVEHLEAFAGFVAVQPGWTGFVERSGADVAVLRAGSALTSAMQDQLGWTVVRRDGPFVYLVAPGARP